MESRRMTVLGASVMVCIGQVDGGYECSYDRQRNPSDSPRYLHCSGRGESVAAAMKKYVAECHRLEQMPLGALYS